MCGGFVAFYSGSDPATGARRLLTHGAYNGGRLVAYAVLGAAVGALGAALDVAGELAGMQRVAAIVAGVVMVAWGAIALLRIGGMRVLVHRASSGVAGRWLRRGMAAIGRRPPLVRATLVGLLTGLLPCGWLWAFLVTAAGTGHPVTGAAVMVAFWIGTVPALVAIGLGFQLVGAPLRRHVPAVTAILVVALGILALVGRPTSVLAGIAARERGPEAATAPAPGKAPCCSSPTE
jgi:sulfite exporter TauE/SafE